MRQARRGPKVQQLRVLLIKEGFSSHDDVLRYKDRLHEFPLRSDLELDGIVYVQPREERKPSWHTFLAPHVEDESDVFADLANKSTSVVLLLTAHGRMWAFTFGYGRNLLNPDVWERDFGLRVVLNRVKSDSLRSVDCHSFEALSVQTRRQASRGTDFEEFGLNVAQDMLRQVAGIPQDESFGRRFAGSDALMLAAPIYFHALPTKCRELLNAYNDDAYQEKYAFIDNMRNERDPVVINALDSLLVETLKSGEHSRLHLAPPEPIDMQAVEGFSFKQRPDEGEVVDELEIEMLLASFEDSVVTIERLKKTKVFVWYEGAEYPHGKWSVYTSLVFEISYKDQYYVLASGDWFEVKRDFVRHIDEQCSQYSGTNEGLLPAYFGEKEKEYNERIARESGYCLIDRKCVRVGGNEIEPCDLLTSDAEMIHVKPWSRSSAVSHLFAQGLVASYCFLDDENFRNQFRTIAHAVGTEFSDHIPYKRPLPPKYKIVFAVIRASTDNWPNCLPFFTKLNFVNVADNLVRLGFEVALVHVKRLGPEKTNQISHAEVGQ